MNPISRILFLLFVLALCVNATPPDQKRRFTAKFERIPSGHITVQVKINGQGPFRFLFDTGSTVTIVGRRAAAASGLAGMKATAAMFEVGDAKCTNLVVGVADTVQPLDGIVGFTFIAQFRTTLNYQKGEITLEPLNLEQQDATGQLRQRMAQGMRAPQSILRQNVVVGIVLEDLGNETREARVVSVWKNSAAEAAGLKRGDRIVEIDGRWIERPLDFYEAIASSSASTSVQIKIERGGKPMELTLKTRIGL